MKDVASKENPRQLVYNVNIKLDCFWSQMRSGTDLSQFLSTFLPTID